MFGRVITLPDMHFFMNTKFKSSKILWILIRGLCPSINVILQLIPEINIEFSFQSVAIKTDVKKRHNVT